MSCAQLLADTYTQYRIDKENSLPVNEALENGCFYTTNGSFIFPIVIDIVVKYENYAKGYEIRNKIRQLLGKFNWQLSADWEWTIAFRQFLSPVYDKENNEIIFGSIYLLKQNYDYADNSD